MKGGKWDARLRRANELAAAQPAAEQGLRFYERVAGFQKSLYADAEARHAAAAPRPPGAVRDELDLDLLIPWFPGLLTLLETVAPAPLAAAARQMGAAGAARWREALAASWDAAADGAAGLAPGDALICWALLQPYAESLADRSAAPPPASGTPRLCPLCSAKPLVGVLRPQGDGGKRTLVCSLCAHEWEYRRIVCAACGEEGVDKLPVYVAAELPHIRVEACDTCKRYIKTVDLTKDGHAVPVVDELAAMALSLWAQEDGYTKIRANCLGL
jgi:FdhE protein